jgi:hypothetical protein
MQADSGFGICPTLQQQPAELVTFHETQQHLHSCNTWIPAHDSRNHRDVTFNTGLTGTVVSDKPWAMERCHVVISKLLRGSSEQTLLSVACLFSSIHPWCCLLTLHSVKSASFGTYLKSNYRPFPIFTIYSFKTNYPPPCPQSGHFPRCFSIKTAYRWALIVSTFLAVRLLMVGLVWNGWMLGSLCRWTSGLVNYL